MVHIGDKIRQLREEKKISRPVFCGDESELSIRQLVRIENGESSPTIERIQYIADRLGVPSYQLMIDYEELPERYKELKYKILRQPAYGDKELLEQLEVLLDEVITVFYDDLPEDERFTIDCMEGAIQVMLYEDSSYGIPIVEEKIDELLEKEIYFLNDLSFFRLLAAIFHKSDKALNPKYDIFFETCFIKLLEQKELFEMKDLFIYMNSIFTGLSYYNLKRNYSLFPKGVKILQEIIKETQDFQKQPLLLMLEWKILLFIDNDLVLAMQKYQEAKILAQMLTLESMIVGLEFEWNEDIAKFSSR